ncbi:hypothetical protein EIP86_005141 [Pleurotus ostreatoroseus]|nr:hypothetical protein EIP86_005141 [Pleurotus ostreatoroseus]
MSQRLQQAPRNTKRDPESSEQGTYHAVAQPWNSVRRIVCRGKGRGGHGSRDAARGEEEGLTSRMNADGAEVARAGRGHYAIGQARSGGADTTAGMATERGRETACMKSVGRVELDVGNGEQGQGRVDEDRRAITQRES